jgi:hypothetical protein
MLVTMHNPELINKLVKLAGGDIDLVQRAIRTASRDGKSADLKAVVEYIQRNAATAGIREVA